MRPWRRWSVRRRVVSVSILALFLSISFGVSAFTLSLDRILYGSALDAARSQAVGIAGELATADSSAVATFRELPSQGALLQLLDANGAVLAASDKAAASKPLSRDRPPSGVSRTDQSASIPGERGEPYALVVRGVRDGRGENLTLVVAVPLDVEANTVRTATELLVVGSVLLLALLTVVLRRTVASALRPVEQIRREVGRIDHAGSAGRVTVPPTDDEIARLAETMNDMLDRLRRADASTRRFVSDASHELRSPLATIRAALEVSDGSGPDTTPERDALLKAETLRMQHLVDGLLTLAKADDRGLPLARDEVDLDDLVDVEVRRLRGTTTMDVRTKISATRVLGDSGRLAQVVRNLTDNAARHSRGWVALSVAPVAGQAVLRVDNQGAPIPEALRERVFDRFIRLDEARQREDGGSGLGLAIARTVVAAHGGTLVATVTEEDQCRFEVRLPLAP